MPLNTATITPAVLAAKDVATVADLDTAVSELNKIYRQPGAPTEGLKANDLWYDTGDDNTSYIYTGSVWELATAPTDLSGYTDTEGMNTAIGTATTDMATNTGVSSAISAATSSFVEASEVAAAVNNNTTKIDGGKIVTASLFAQDIGFTGKITGGSGGLGGLGGIIQSANYQDGVAGMKIDLVDGSIYIA